jgi:hypothetical protein
VLSDFILQEACFTPDGLPTGWATRVYRGTAEICLDVVLRNLAELDWRVRTTNFSEGQSPVPNKEPGRALLDLIWDDVEESFRGSTLAERKAWLTRLARIAPMQPHRLWPLVEIVLNLPAAEDKDNNSLELNPWMRPTTQDEVLTALAPVLRGIAHDERFTARCADLLWEIGRDATGRPGYSSGAMEALRQLASFERGKPLDFNFIILERSREWMRDPNIHGYAHSVLDVISPLLSHRMESAEPDGRWIRSGSMRLPDDPLRELRQGALELVELCAQSGDRKAILEALQTLRGSVTEMGLWHLRFEDPADWQAGEWEVMAALKIVGRIARRNADPFVRLKIWEYLHLQAERGPRPEVQRGAREILDAIPHSFETRLILLMTGNHGFEQYSTTWTDSNESPSDDLEIDQATRLLKDQKRHKRNEEFVRQATLEWIEKYPNVRLGFDALDELMGRIESSGWWKDRWTRSNPLMLQLAIDHPPYAREWCEIALERPDSRATGMCDDLLCELRRQDQTGALGLPNVSWQMAIPICRCELLEVTRGGAGRPILCPRSGRSSEICLIPSIPM